MRRLVIRILSVIWLALALAFPFTVEAEITDPVQKKDWFYLQTLSTQASTLSTCIIVTHHREPDAADLKPAIARYYDLTDQLGKEVSLYLKNYATRKEKWETEDGFAYKVWHAVIKAGLDSIEENKKKRDLCPLILKSP